MKLGIIGLDGAGKSTLFEALTKVPSEGMAAKAADRFGTIRVPDGRIDWLTDLYQPRKTTYAQIEYYLPGLAGFGQGKQKDEAVLTQVRSCDALVHVVRNFTAYGLEPPAPAGDFQRLDQEMMFADLLVVEKRLERLILDKKRGRDLAPDEEALLTRCKEMLEKEIPLRRHPEVAGSKLLRGFTLLSAKPQLVLFNNHEEDADLPAAGTVLEQEKCLAVRGKVEQELASMSAEDAAEFLREFGIATSAMDRVIAASYELLGLISFFTVGLDEVRAWTIRRHTAALDAAEVIHSDIKKGFIRAEVLAYDDLVAAGSYKEARNRGTVRLEGKTYEVRDGDIIEFRFNV